MKEDIVLPHSCASNFKGGANLFVKQEKTTGEESVSIIYCGSSSVEDTVGIGNEGLGSSLSSIANPS